MTRIGIVMPVLNQFKFALKAINSIKTVHSYDILVVPNWELGLGVAQSWNKGMEWSTNNTNGCDYTLILNDDILLAPYAIDRLVEAMNNDPEIGVATCRDYRGGMATPEDILGFVPSDSYIADGPDFAAFMIRPEAYEDIGPFDERFHPAYFEDNDYCHRTIVKKWKCVSHMGAAFYHYGSRTQNHGIDPVVPSPVFEDNRNYYIAKWGSVPGHEKWTVPFNGQG